MTSQQLNTQLKEAIRIIGLCEDVLTDPEKSSRKGYDLDALCAVQDFMDAHRQALAEGGAA